MTEMQGAVGLAQLKKLDFIVKTKEKTTIKFGKQLNIFQI